MEPSGADLARIWSLADVAGGAFSDDAPGLGGLHGGAELGRGHAGAGLEEAHEMLRVFESQAVAYLGHAETDVIEKPLRFGDQVVRDEVLGCLSGLHLDEFSEVPA